jgi:hypothetical protein
LAAWASIDAKSGSGGGFCLHALLLYESLAYLPVAVAAFLMALRAYLQHQALAGEWDSVDEQRDIKYGFWATEENHLRIICARQ